MTAGSLCLWIGAATFAASEDPTPPPGPFVCSAATAGNTDVWRIDAQTRTRLTTHDAVDNWPVPSPDGQRIAFQTQRAGSYDVWIVRADGSSPARELVGGPGHDGLPVWSPDGAEIAFFSDRDVPDGTPGALPGHVYRMRLDGGRPERVTRTPLASTLGPSAWSPDGTSLLISRTRTGTGIDVLRLDLASGREDPLTSDPTDEYGARYARAGDRIAFYATTETRSDVVVLDPATGKRRVLTSDPGWHYVEDWSPDDAWLSVLSYTPDFARSTNRLLFVADGASVRLAAPPGARELRFLPVPTPAAPSETVSD